MPFAIFLGEGLAVGEHTIVVDILEQGNPWENTRTYTWTFSANPPLLQQSKSACCSTISLRTRSMRALS